MFNTANTAMFVSSLTKRFPTGGNYCISNILSNGYVARYNTKADVFFNRKKELVLFRNAFSHEKPRLHVILGPPSTGKTALIREITTKNKDFNPLFINCRKGQFDSPENVYNSLSTQFKSFFDKQNEYLKKLPNFELELMLPAFFDLGLKLSVAEKRKEEITSHMVSKLLNKIAGALPNWSFWNGYGIPQPILVIDEANLFSQLADSSKEGALLLKSFLNWLVVNTKEEKRFHAILTSSDSFFINWIENQLHIPHATPYIVGDLSKEEAEEYFEEHVLPRYGCEELKGKFDHIRKITGTRMLIIDMYVNEYQDVKGKLEYDPDDDFSVFRQEGAKLWSGLYPLNAPNKPIDPLWDGNDLIKVMKKFVDAKDEGFVLERDLIKEIGKPKLYSLVYHNFLHRRPTNKFANDLDAPKNEVILTVMNQPSLCAMERILMILK